MPWFFCQLPASPRQGRWARACPRPEEGSLIGGGDTSQGFQETLKISALREPRRARRVEAMVCEGRAEQDKNLGRGCPQHPAVPILCWGQGQGEAGADTDFAWGTARTRISHRSAHRTIANSSAEGVI